MRQHLIPLVAVLLLASTAAAQRPPDLKQLLPDEYTLYVSADGERIRASSLWSTLLRTVAVGKQLASLPVKLGFDLDDVDRMVLGNVNRDGEEWISVLVAGKPALRAGAFVEAMGRSKAKLTEETIGGRKAWLPEGRRNGPGTADLGPGTLWLASPAVLRERLGATERPGPAKPSPTLETVLGKEGGAVFVAVDGTHGLLEPLQRLAAGAGLRQFRALGARIELTPVLEADFTLVPDPEDDPAKVKTFLQEKIAEGAEELKAQKLPILAKQCSQIVVEVRGRAVGCVFKLAKGQESALIAAVSLFWLRMEVAAPPVAVQVDATAVLVEEKPVAVSRPASQPAPKR